MELNAKSIESNKMKLIKNEYSVTSNGLNQDFIFWNTCQLDFDRCLQSAWINVCKSSEIIEIPLKKRGVINVIFMDLGEKGLYDYPTEEILIDKSLESSECEATLFHELIHYYYFHYFLGKYSSAHLYEGLATYFERYFYPRERDDFSLLIDRLNGGDYSPVLSFGYYLYCNYFDDLKTAFHSQNIDEYMKNNFDEISDIEYKALLMNLAENLICFVCCEERSLHGIFFSVDLKVPYLIHPRSENLSRIIEYNNRLDFFSIDKPLIIKEEKELFLNKADESDWETIANILAIAHRKNPIKKEYKFYANSPSINQLATI